MSVICIFSMLVRIVLRYGMYLAKFLSYSDTFKMYSMNIVDECSLVI